MARFSSPAPGSGQGDEDLTIPVSITDNDGDDFITFTRTNTGTARIATPQDDLSLRSARDITLIAGDDGPGNVYIGWGDATITPDATNRVATIADINAVNTGDITFDGVKIIGAGTASGDGGNLGTIELVPDGDLNSDQYLIIDPTGPNHIHIRAGGEQDNSGAELILGAEKTNVLINDWGGRVEIHSKPSSDGDVYQNINSEPGNTLSVNTDLTYLLDSPREGTNFVIANEVKYEITSWSVTEGVTNIVAGDFAFDANGFYGVFREYPSNEWSFDSDGYLYGPADGYLPVQGLLGPSGEIDLEIVAPTAVVINGQFGEFLNSSGNSDNQIATIGDVNAARFGASASFFSTADQGPHTANAIQAFTFNNTDWATGVTLGSTTQVTMTNAGKYNIAFSAQLHQTNSSGVVNIWLNKNGTPMANTNTKVAIASNNPFAVAAWNFFVDAAAGDYYELMWSSASNHTVIEHDVATGSGATLHPAVPSVILTVNQVG
jgi:hypothetical protein